jgi:photosystem II stability/assembly factor-like uncharacterized protein
MSRLTLSLVGLSLIAFALICGSLHATESTSSAGGALGVKTDLAQLRAIAKDTDDKFRALSPDQRAKVFRNLQPILKGLGPRREAEAEYLHAIQFYGSRGWALDWQGRLHNTFDGGVTWTERRLPAGGGIIGRLYEKFDVPVPEQAGFRNMYFADERFGLIVGGAGVLQSKDGGETWQALPSPSPRHAQMAVFCTVGHRCWVTGGEDHVVFRRDDDPQSNWSRQNTPVTGSIRAIQFIDQSTGWAVSAKGEIIATKDGGEHWTEVLNDPHKEFWGINFVDQQLGWVVGANALIMRTEDGGRTWAEQKIPLPPQVPTQEVRLHAVKFADAKHGWVAGRYGMIFATTDGGETWKNQRFEGLREASWLTIYSLAITEGPTIWAAGNSGNILVSTDGGAFWFPVHGVAVQVYEELRRIMEHPAN